MKKILLLAAAAAMTVGAQAAVFGSQLTVSYNGETVAEGATIDCDEYEDYDAIVPGMGCQFTAEVDLTNNGSSDAVVELHLTYGDHPTKAEALADPSVWGTPQVCIKGGSCFESDVTWTFGAGKTDTYQIENKGLTLAKAEPNRIYVIQLVDQASGETFTFNVRYQPDSAVNEIATENGKAEYFNLQGQRVENPTAGLYIVKANGKTSKTLIR